MITNNKEKEKTITDKTDIVFKQMHKEILAIESKYKMMIDKIQFNEYLDAEQKKDAIKDLQQEKQLHIYQKKFQEIFIQIALLIHTHMAIMVIVLVKYGIILIQAKKS